MVREHRARVRRDSVHDRSHPKDAERRRAVAFEVVRREAAAPAARGPWALERPPKAAVALPESDDSGCAARGGGFDRDELLRVPRGVKAERSGGEHGNHRLLWCTF